MQDQEPLIVFILDEQRFAVRLVQVERVALAVEVTPLPGAPAAVLGFIDLAGQVVPVLNVRRRFKASGRAVRTSDQFVVVRTAAHRLAMLVDDVEGLTYQGGLPDPGANWVQETQAGGWFDGVVRIAGGLALIHDLEKFLSLEESQALGRAVEAMQ